MAFRRSGSFSLQAEPEFDFQFLKRCLEGLARMNLSSELAWK